MEDTINKFFNNVEKLYELNPDGTDGFSFEFQKIKSGSASLKKQPGYQSTCGENDNNKKKNRYKDILPYDRSRVKLPKTRDNSSDYINASFIKGAGQSGKYIASQGPLPHTVNDFWRMLWQYNVKIIIMVCREIELGKRKCERYWAGDEKERRQFDDIIVTLESEQNLKSVFFQRNIIAQKGQEKRTLTQLHYVTWPDHGVPRTRDEILTMIATARKLQDYKQDIDNPICVHCSAGCGRTGAVLVIDYFRNLMVNKQLPNNITAYEIIVEMRKQRPAIVQTKDQYEFVHLAISEMFTKYLKEHGVMEPTSSLSKSLLSTNYENVVLPVSASPPKTRRSNSKEIPRQSYENVALPDNSEKAQHRTAVGHSVHPSPPPKPGRNSAERKNGGLAHPKPVSSSEPSNHKLLAMPVPSARKQSFPGNGDSKQAPPKPSLQKRGSDSKSQMTGHVPRKPSTPENTNPCDSPSFQQVKPTPRYRNTGATSEYASAQGKIKKDETNFASDSTPNLASNVSVFKLVNVLHAKSNFSNPPPVKPKPKINAENKVPIVESVQMRKERLWSYAMGNEPSNLQKTSPTVTASAIDLRMIDESKYKNPRKPFTRTMSVDKGNIGEKTESRSVLLHQDKASGVQNSSNSLTSSNECKDRINPFKKPDKAITNKQVKKPPVLPKKSFRSKLKLESETSDKVEVRNNQPIKSTHTSSSDSKHLEDNIKPKYVNVQTSLLSNNTTSEYADVDITVSVSNASVYTPLNMPKVTKSGDGAYDVLKRSFKTPSTSQDTTDKNLSEADHHSSTERTVVHNTAKKKNIWMDSPQPFSRSPLSSTTSSVFETSPTSTETNILIHVTQPDLLNSVSDTDIKTPKSVPIKPQRASKKPKPMTTQATTTTDTRVYTNQETYSTPKPHNASNSKSFGAYTSPTNQCHSGPPDNSQPGTDLSNNRAEDDYAMVDNTKISSRKAGLSSQEKQPVSNSGPPNLPNRPQFAEAPTLPTRTLDSYIINEDENSMSAEGAYEGVGETSSYEGISDLKPNHQETGRRTSGAGALAGVRAKAKGVIGKVTALHNRTGARANEESNYDPSSRNPTYKQSPVMCGNQDISFNHCYPRKPKGARANPAKWNSYN
uniref:protein-tyrosine-phosphatase n=1 Tax=Phallusia mammillata TaxID=59560 RepID=A0A6F9DQL1_9ASCI|nr:tyrosine-protein phosphatase non-receptor type 12-like [Phallusia mammillata]